MGQTRYGEAIDAFRESLSLSDGFVQPLDYDLNGDKLIQCLSLHE